MNNKTISKMTRTLIPLLLLTVIFTVGISAVSAAPGDTMYVNDTGGDDNNDGLTWETAKKTILNATELVNENGIVNIANGQYTGTNNTGITIKKNMTINGESQTGTIINGSGSNRIFDINPGINVTISNLTLTNGNSSLQNGGAIYVNSGSTVSISNCDFTYNSASSTSCGAIFYRDSSGTITDCNFINNTADFQAGAIYSYRSNLTITNSNFTKNYVINNGGAIYNDQSNLIVINSTFTNNTGLTSSGGAICNGLGNATVTGSTFINNTAGSGGAICNGLGNATVTGSTFINNTVEYTGGVINNIEGNVTLTDCNLINNTAGDKGGAIYNNNGNLTINNSQIKQNTAYTGAGIYCNEETPITGNVVINNTLISDNVATNSAGGIMTYLPMIITDSIIRNNTAGYGGGILQYNHGNLTIINCLIENNTATDDIGGGIYSETYSDAFLTILNSAFTGNSAERGGALYDYNEGHTTITGCLFSGNSATLEGGAIFKYDNYDSIDVHFCRIVDNTAPTGANIYNYQNSNFNAENNWWGSNAGPTGIAEGISEHIPVDADPWLIMELTSNPTTIKQGETSELTASFNRNSDGVLVGDENNHIPDGTPVTFTTNLGNVGSKSITLGTINGIATATLRGDEAAGTALLSAFLDSQTIYTHVTINAATNNNTNNNTAHAASTVSMQHTGVPIVALILALFMVIGGMVSSKK